MTATQTITGSQDVLELLRRGETYPTPTEQVDVVETHISWVFLTERHVYKLKKPIQFDFLDYSTVEARHQACEDEVRLNRRLAPDVYNGVLPITQQGGRLGLDGHGEPVDWVVQMRRLPADRMLDKLICNWLLTSKEIEAVGDVLADFYRQAAAADVSSTDYRERMIQHVLENRAELSDPEHELPLEVVKRVHAAQLRVLELQRDLFDQRVAAGRVVDGHGDLRPEHICVEDPPVVFDCIEFSSELRTIDVADELSFLAMECAYLGAEHVGNHLLARCCAALDDRPPERLLDFYKCYRACVRAKVCALKASQSSGKRQLLAESEANEYLRMADRYATRLGSPLLILVRGLMGTGKSTLAGELSRRLGMEVLHTDAIRRELFGPPSQADEYNRGRYRPRRRQQVYDEMLLRATALLREGKSVILDGTFLTNTPRKRAVAMARRWGASPMILTCKCPDRVAIERIAQRQDGGSDSEARPELLQQQRQDLEAVPPHLPAATLDTTQPLEEQVEQALIALGEQSDVWRPALGAAKPSIFEDQESLHLGTAPRAIGREGKTKNDKVNEHIPV